MFTPLSDASACMASENPLHGTFWDRDFWHSGALTSTLPLSSWIYTLIVSSSSVPILLFSRTCVPSSPA